MNCEWFPASLAGRYTRGARHQRAIGGVAAAGLDAARGASCAIVRRSCGIDQIALRRCPCTTAQKVPFVTFCQLVIRPVPGCEVYAANPFTMAHGECSMAALDGPIEQVLIAARTRLAAI
jgi:hypothetical protein